MANAAASPIVSGPIVDLGWIAVDHETSDVFTFFVAIVSTNRLNKVGNVCSTRSTKCSIR